MGDGWATHQERDPESHTGKLAGGFLRVLLSWPPEMPHANNITPILDKSGGPHFPQGISEGPVGAELT